MTTETEYLEELNKLIKELRDKPNATLRDVIMYDAVAELRDAIDRGDTEPWKCYV